MSNQSLEEAALPLARRWMQECIASHDSCLKKARHSSIFCTDNLHLINDLDSSGLIPSRLLTFGTDTEVVRIAESSSLSPDIEYVALSHRWGTNETCRATTENLKELIEGGIPFSQLPRTFREAMHVTRGLGYSYLWIDSLCIVQDDEEDWKNESLRMGIIYDHAVCTIAAMDGTDNDSGLFVRDSTNCDVGILSSRGWVCQEEMISPRSLMFTAGTVIWECRECDASEHNPRFHNLTRPLQSDGTLTHLKDIFAFFRDWRLPSQTDVRLEDEEAGGGVGDKNSNSKEDDPHRFGSFAQPVMDLLYPRDIYYPFLRIWWQFISAYTPRSLTHDSDKFLAMNGITKISQRSTHLKNTFGLWYHFLEIELCWYVDSARPEASRPATWLGPSWSWINTRDGCVRNDMYHRFLGNATLLLKPQIGMPVGTSFDQSLPIPAWLTPKYHQIELTGDLRKGRVTAVQESDGKVRYLITLDTIGRFSEEETHDFRPDCPHEFSVGHAVDVYCLLIWHCDAQSWKPGQYVDIRLVMRHASEGKTNIGFHTEFVDKEQLADERTMTRVGYLETLYRLDKMRSQGDIHEDLWWRWVRLV